MDTNEVVVHREQRDGTCVTIASGEVEDRAPTPEEQGKDAAAVALGKKGGAHYPSALTLAESTTAW